VDRSRITGVVAVIALVVGIGLYVQSEWGGELRVMRQRASMPDAPEPFFPAEEPRAAAIAGSVRQALVRWADDEAARREPDAAEASEEGASEDDATAGDDDDSAEAPEPAPPLTEEALLEAWPDLGDVAYGERWIISVYTPTPGDWIRPAISTLDGGVLEAAGRVWKDLPAAGRTPEGLARTHIKVDYVVSERPVPGPTHDEDGKPIPGDDERRDPKGWNIDEGLDGIVLRHPKEGEFWFLPSLAVERKVSRRKIHARARFYARELAGWRSSRTKKAEVALFRTHAWVESEPGGPMVAVTRGNTDVPEVTPEVLRERIALAADFLTRETNDLGAVTYEYQAATDKVPGNDYNILRHAGTVYSMVQGYRLTGDERTLQASIRAMGFYLRATREDKANPGERYVLSVSRLRQSGAPRIGSQAKLGGIGLGLCMMAELEKARPGTIDMEIALQMARHVDRMQNPDGSFDSFYDHSGRGAKLRKSIYYSGEAILGLIRMYELTGDEHYLDVAERGADYLVNERWASLGLRIYIPPDAWLIQALEELDRFRPDDRRADYAFDIGETIARHKLMDPLRAPPDMLGADLSSVGSMPNSATAGSFGEALSAAARLEARRRPDQTRFRTFAMYNAGFQIRNQYWGPNDYYLPNPERAFGGFRVKPDAGEVRNDYVQHNLSGLFGLLDLLDETAPDIGEVVQR